MKLSAASVLAAILAFAGCVKPPPRPVAKLVAHPHYLLGAPYQADGHWYYPAEDFQFDGTGLADILPDGSRLTADGELFDPAALTASMQTVQLPCVAVVTNLENGRQIEVRVNDRGPADPGRLIALSPRAALLLQMTGVGRVEVRLDTALSHRVVDQIGGPKLNIALAPTSVVKAESLPPPGSHLGPGAATVVGAQAPELALSIVPERMPEIIHAVGASPGQLWLRAGSFTRFQYANRLAAKLAGLGGDVLRSREERQAVFAVRAGPFATVAQADAALRRALAAGVVDARITVE